MTALYAGIFSYRYEWKSNRFEYMMKGMNHQKGFAYIPLLIIVAFIVIASAAYYFYANFGFPGNYPPPTQQPTSNTQQVQPSPTLLSPVLPNQPPVASNHSSNVAAGNQDNLVSEFINSNYRVLKVIESIEKPDHLYSLIVATERSKNITCGDPKSPSRCANDAGCGSIYTSRACYFFLEPQFIVGANANTHFVAQWQGSLDGLDLESIKFMDANNIEFKSAGGDAGLGIEATWNLNLQTGKITEVSHTIQNATP